MKWCGEWWYRSPFEEQWRDVENDANTVDVPSKNSEVCGVNDANTDVPPRQQWSGVENDDTEAPPKNSEEMWRMLLIVIRTFFRGNSEVLWRMMTQKLLLRRTARGEWWHYIDISTNYLTIPTQGAISGGRQHVLGPNTRRRCFCQLFIKDI